MLYKSKHKKYIEYPTNVTDHYKIYFMTASTGMINYKVVYYINEKDVWARTFSTSQFTAGILSFKNATTGTFSTQNRTAKVDILIDIPDDMLRCYDYYYTSNLGPGGIIESSETIKPSYTTTTNFTNKNILFADLIFINK